MDPSLAEAFAKGLLVRPSDERANLVHLTRALAAICGVPGVHRNEPVQRIGQAIGTAQHVLFVLLDGLGMNLVRRLDADSFLRSHLAMQIDAVCPSTTACALTSVATACYPSRHAVTGWFTYDPQLGLSVMTLPFAERYTRQPLVERGLRAEDWLPVPAFWGRMSHRPMTLLPTAIADTAYARYSRGYTDFAAYASIPHAIDLAVQRIRDASGPTYTHLYLPDVDTLCHHIGAEQPEVLPLVHRIQSELKRLADALAGRTRIVISADHGLIDVPTAQQTILRDGDRLLELLVVPPTGDARMPIFHVRDRCAEEFAACFASRMSPRMTLMATAEAERQQLFGPEKLSAVARRRFGDFVGISMQPVTMSYAPPGTAQAAPYIGQHAGLSPQEMEIPLFVV